MNKKTIRDIDIKAKKILLRVDYNVSLDHQFRISDDYRINQTLATINYLREQDCSIILLSHLGRPKGKPDSKYSLLPVHNYLKKIYKSNLIFYTKDINLSSSQKELASLIDKKIVLLENIRFYPGEEKNSRSFSQLLASLAEIYVNDAFGVSHRAHASTVGITEFLPSVAGLLLEKEVDVIRKAIDRPKRPLTAIIGGAKAEDKITLVGKLLEKADYCLVGGGTANTFLKAWGYDVGQSKVCHEMVELTKQLFWKAARKKTAMMLPSDVVLGNLKNQTSDGVVAVNNIPSSEQALDIGPKTQAEFGHIIAKSKTIIWNGPMGVFEQKAFRNGTDFIYYAITQNPDAMTIVGGGDTIAALPKEEYLKSIDHVSTGGGAMLEFIEKGSLPGIDALLNK